MSHDNLKKRLAEVRQLEAEFSEKFHDILVEEGMKVVLLWAKAFPKRDLRFLSGMGTGFFDCSSFDVSVYCDRNTRNYSYSNRAAEMLSPLVDFCELFWSSEYVEYPAIHDIFYNPQTRTVECGHDIIHLDQEDV